MTIQEWYDYGQPFNMWSYNNTGLVVDECITIHDTGEQEVFEVQFEDGSVERVTLEHKFLCSDGEYHTVEEIYHCGLDVARVEAGVCCVTA